jgi:hypothetical protein
VAERCDQPRPELELASSIADLFVREDFISHAGLPLRWKIECDALTDNDIDCLAFMLGEVVPPFYDVYGIPRGGVRIAAAMEQYITEDAVKRLIVDDVLTTGKSMNEVANNTSANVHGAVIFARGPVPAWITPLFRMAGC